MRRNTASFLGLAEPSEDEANAWDNRRLRIAGSMGHGVTEEYRERSSEQLDTSGRKKSVLEMSIDAIRPKGQSETDNVTQDDTSVPYSKKRSNDRRGTTVSKRTTIALSDTDSIDCMTDLKRIKNRVLMIAGSRRKRQMGVGTIGLMMKTSVRGSVLVHVRDQIDNFDDHRPYFTYWITCVQTVIMIAALSVYGFAPVGIEETHIAENVRMPNLAFQTEYRTERENMWWGPRQADLIHLGAKYSLCMHEDDLVRRSIGYDKEEESQTACCIRKDKSGCSQTVKSGCDITLSEWHKWTREKPGPDGRLSGSVCGQDPRYCKFPASSPPFTWPDLITQWPICTTSEGKNESNDYRKKTPMFCELLGRPCCFGIQGHCLITTWEHCELLKGFFHPEAVLCAQVNCLEQICGMFPFAKPGHPDQFYRVFSSIFLHAGLIHLGFTIIFQMWIMRDLEKLLGSFRIMIIYMLSGVIGNLASCIFTPYLVEVGPSGSQFSILACLLVEVIQSYQMYRHPYIAICKLCTPILLLFILGLLPWIDNWAHIFGFIFGFLLAFALVPYLTFGQFDQRRKLITVFASLGAALGLLFVMLMCYFYSVFKNCSWCVYVSCVPFTSDFCNNMAVILRTNFTYTKVYSESQSRG